MSRHTALDCPQCGGSLPRQAWWKMVTCPYCQAHVTLADDVVQAAQFREAYLRSQVVPAGARVLHIARQRYYVVQQLGSGTSAEVFLCQSVGACPQQVVVKMARDASHASAIQQEFRNLQALQAYEGAGAAYFSTRLPQPIACAEYEGRTCLVLRHPTGYWGSLDHVLEQYRHGIDPRHAVWLWRRLLEVLGYLHGSGWSHGKLELSHALVQPLDHGVQMISFGAAQQERTGHLARVGRDLVQSAWLIRSLIAGPSAGPPAIHSHLAPSMATLLQRASEDSHWCQQTGAHGIEQQLKQAARAAFGPPRFLHFSPTLSSVSASIL